MAEELRGKGGGVNDVAAAGPVKTRTLRTRDLDLVPAGPEHASEVYQGWLHDPDVIRFLEVQKSDRSMPALRRFLSDVAADPERYFFMISRRADGCPVGTISIHLEGNNRRAQFGVMIGEKTLWGTDVGLQAHVSLIDFAFDQVGLNKLMAMVVIENQSMHLNCCRLGFVREGVLREHIFLGEAGDRPVDVAYYGLLARDWADVREKFSALR